MYSRLLLYALGLRGTIKINHFSLLRADVSADVNKYFRGEACLHKSPFNFFLLHLRVRTRCHQLSAKGLGPLAEIISNF